MGRSKKRNRKSTKNLDKPIKEEINDLEETIKQETVDSEQTIKQETNDSIQELIIDTKITQIALVEYDPNYFPVLPHNLFIKSSTVPGAELGVWSNDAINKGFTFGPYESVVVDDPTEAKNNVYWEVSKNEQIDHYLIAKDESETSWLRYINYADEEEQQNIVAFQHNQLIYYHASKFIPPQTELLLSSSDNSLFESAELTTFYKKLGNSDTEIEDCQQIETKKISNQEENRIFNWSPEATKLLINTYGQEKWKLQSPNFRKKHVWISIAQILNTYGYSVSKDQVENKWKSLNGNYKKTKHKNSISVAQRHYCQFYEELDEILKEDPVINPLSTASNLTGLIIKQESDSESSSGISSEQSKTTQSTKKRKYKEIPSWVTDLKEKLDSNEEKANERDRERLQVLKEILETEKIKVLLLEKVTCKLCEK